LPVVLLGDKLECLALDQLLLFAALPLGPPFFVDESLGLPLDLALLLLLLQGFPLSSDPRALRLPLGGRGGRLLRQGGVTALLRDRVDERPLRLLL